MEIMTPDHERWPEFCRLLLVYLNRTPCCCNFFHPRAYVVLTMMGFDVEGSLTNFVQQGGLCDCGILENVSR